MRQALGAAERVLTSELTLVECERVLHRARALGELTEATAAERRARLLDASAAWHRFPIDEEIVTRARQSFPVEPIRSLDALHLATALTAAATVPALELLSLDTRVRDCGAALGLRLLPTADKAGGKSGPGEASAGAEEETSED